VVVLRRQCLFELGDQPASFLGRRAHDLPRVS
jgi:hypothetical protein